MHNYPPPPLLLYLVLILYYTATNPILVLLALFLYWIYPHCPPPQSNTMCAPRIYGLRTYPDISLALPWFHLAFSAMQLHPHYYWCSTYLPAKKHPLCNYPCCLAHYFLPAHLCTLRASKYITNGFQVYHILPCSIMTCLVKLFSDLGGSTCHLLRHKPRLRPIQHAPLVTMLALNTAMCHVVFTRKAPLKFCRYTHSIIQRDPYRQTSFLVNMVFNMEHLEPHFVNFDTRAFDILFDNCANHTVSLVKSDFTI